KLAEKRLVTYQKYKGVELTVKGNEVATSLIRKHRLWESFLVEKLQFSWNEVHDIAEQLEHIKSELLVDRLDALLGFPKFDPHGDPIPDRHGKFTLRSQTPLFKLEIGESGIVIAVQNHEKDYLAFLDELNIQIGTPIRLLETFGFDESVKIEVANDKQHLISNHVSRNIYVRKV
ncbi:MAG: metal-dependent transcriptional regulator, partial [Saprospiraceae bacterium]|nr:metal-dependent transcriptional regulator [Saprospiraceae bacterium]